jgi:hypothetical protein
MDGDLALRLAQDFAQTRIEIQALGGQIELRDGFSERVVRSRLGRLFDSHGNRSCLSQRVST